MNHYFIKNSTLIASIIFVLSSCGENKSASNSNEELSKPKVLSILKDEIYLMSEPNSNSDKLINEKATKAIGETIYLQVDRSTKIVIKESRGDWMKINVVKPEHLSKSHVGWIESEFIESDKSSIPEDIIVLDESKYEIIKTNHNSSIQNFYVLSKGLTLNENSLNKFFIAFRKKHCNGNCNVDLFDTNTIAPLLGKYPLEDNEYIKFADAFVASSDFDSETAWLYPFQDMRYKELGGTNWKKAPIK